MADLEENARRKAAGKKEILLSPIAIEVVRRKGFERRADDLILGCREFRSSLSVEARSFEVGADARQRQAGIQKGH